MNCLLGDIEFMLLFMGQQYCGCFGEFFFLGIQDAVHWGEVAWHHTFQMVL